MLYKIVLVVFWAIAMLPMSRKIVNAMFLKEPESHAFLVFIKRIDDKKIPFPKGTIVVPISDLRFP